MDKLSLKYLGHSAFLLKNNEFGILIDPFISQNPLANFDYTKEKITHIIVTHGHSDHIGDAIPISKNLNVPIIAPFELATICQTRGAIAIPANPGGKLLFDFGYVVLTSAIHSSSYNGNYAGNPCGVVIDFLGKTFHHAGDTALSQEMKTIQEVYSPFVSMLPIGGTFTMDIHEASIAANWLKSPIIVPMHYNTFPQINTDVNAFKEMIDFENQTCKILKVNDELEF